MLRVIIMFNRIREWFSIRLAKNPGQIVLLSILFFNVVFLLLSAFIISRMSLTGTEHLGFLQSAYYTISMILDAGGVAYVVEDIGPQNAAIAIVCLLIVIIGMISFTGAVIGYITNYISSFIESSNAGNHKLHISGHFVILNWNSRALEIVNDILPQDRPRYLMGVGTPGNLLEGIERGVDMFDCVMPTRNGRNAMLFTSEGIMNMRNKKWETDFSPIDPNGSASVDTCYTKAYLHHLFKAQELLALEIASMHNLASTSGS